MNGRVGESTSVLWARPFVPAWVPFIYAVLIFVKVQDVYERWSTRYERAAMLCLLGVGFLLTVLGSARRRADIGAEGIRIVGWLFGRRMIPYRNVRRAVAAGTTKLVVTTMNGELIELHAGAFRATMPKDVLERLWKAIAAGAEDGSRGTERQALARSGRTTPQWRTALRELAKPPTYRQATLSHERLWSIAENPGIDAEVRAAAIVALSSSSLDDQARTRIRRIDAATVDPALHALLDHAGADRGELDDRAIDTALDGLARS